MRTMSAAETAKRAALAFTFAIRVRIEDWTGAFKDVDRDMSGNSFFVGASWGEDNDGQGPTGEVTIRRSFFQTSVSPFMSASPVNKAWADPATTSAQLFLDVYRRIQIDYYMAAGDEPVGGESWTNVFDGRIDKFRLADEGNVVLECRDKRVAEFAEAFYERERYYGLTPGSYAYQKGLQAWFRDTPTLTFAVNELIVPSTLNGFIYRVQSITTGIPGATEPVWPTTIGVTVVSGGVTFICDAATAAAGTVTMEQVIQQMLNDSGISYTWNAPTATAFVMNAWKEGRGPVLEACKKVALLIGADVRPRWTNSAARFDVTLYIPDRAVSSTSATISADEVKRVTQLDIDIAGVRNAGSIIYTSTVMGPDGKTPLRKRVDDKRQTSIDRFGRRWFEISEDATTGVRTAQDADRFLDAALDDMSAPKAEFGADIEFFPWAQLGDYYSFAPNGEHFDSTQDLAVVSYRHEVTTSEDGKTAFGTALQCRGKPSRGYDCWQAIEARPGFAEAHDVVFIGGGADVTVLAEMIAGAKLMVQEKLDRQTKWDGAEIHISKTSGFTPSSSTLQGVAKASEFEVQNLDSGQTYYARAIPRGVNAGQLIVGDPTAEVSFVAGFARPKHIHPGMELGVGALPLNGNFEVPGTAGVIPDCWESLTGTFGTDWTTDTEQSYDGGCSVKFLATAVTAAIRAAYQPVRPSIGALLEVAVRPQAAFPGSRLVSLAVEWYTATKSLISTSSTNLDLSTITAGAWSVRRVPFTAPATAAFARVKISEESLNADFTWHVDAVKLSQGGGDSTWHAVGAAGEPAFANSWANFGGGWAAAAFFKDANGIVHLRGMITAGTLNAYAFTLPVGYRPVATEGPFACLSNNAMGRAEVDTAGGVRIGANAIGSNVWFSLAGITFMADI